jgi:hypothetical protein
VRTTVTLDPDARQLVERTMRERGLSFKEAVNFAIRAGLSSAREPATHYTASRPLGARTDLAKALTLAGELEDEANLRKLAEGR